MCIFLLKCFAMPIPQPRSREKKKINSYPFTFVLFKWSSMVVCPLSYIYSVVPKTNHGFQVYSFNLLCAKCTNKHCYFVMLWALLILSGIFFFVLYMLDQCKFSFKHSFVPTIIKTCHRLRPNNMTTIINLIEISIFLFMSLVIIFKITLNTQNFQLPKCQKSLKKNIKTSKLDLNFLHI
jgi:hypothetical protein